MKNPRQKPISKKREELTFAIGLSSLGLVLVALSEFGVVSVLIGNNQKHLIKRLQDRFPKNLLREDKKGLKAVLPSAIRCIENPTLRFDFPLNMRGTLFQRRVWEATQKIPLGETSTYSDIALQIRSPRSMRAVGSACTNNHFTLIVPCHRVLHKGESVSGGFSRSSKRQQEFIMREVKANSKIKKSHDRQD